MRIAITGGRDYGNRHLVASVLDLIGLLNGQSVILVGDCPTGVDAFVVGRRKDAQVFRAEWSKFNIGAGPIRNRAILDSGVDIVIAFPGGRGTSNMVKQARERNIPVIELR